MKTTKRASVPSSEYDNKYEDNSEDVVIPPPIEEAEIFSAETMVEFDDIRAKAIEAMNIREKDARRTTLGDDWAAQQQRAFARKSETRRMTLI